MHIDLDYVAALLRFTAVPLAVFELFPKARRSRTEDWLFSKLKPAIISLGVALLIVYIATFVVVKFGPYLVLLFYLLGQGLWWWIADWIEERLDTPGYVSSIMFFGPLTVGLVALVLAFLPQAWIIVISWPFESFSHWATGHPFLNLLVPDYSSRSFIANYQSVFNTIHNWLWSWLAWVNSFTFFWAKGVLFALAILIQVAFVVALLLGGVIAVMVPAYLFVLFSEVVKKAFGFEHEKGRIPVGAAVLVALGEALEFALKTLSLFSASHLHAP